MDQITIKFFYQNNPISIYVTDRNESMKLLFERFGSKIGMDPKDFYFMYNATPIDLNQTKTLNDLNKTDKLITILALKFDDDNPNQNDNLPGNNNNMSINNSINNFNSLNMSNMNNNSNIMMMNNNPSNFMNMSMNMNSNMSQNKNQKESKTVLCPFCKSLSVLKIDGYKIITDNCIQGHTSSNNLSFMDFNKSQFYDESSILCSLCGKSKMDTFANKFHLCSCGMFLCPMCENNHQQPGHSSIDFDEKDYFCISHGERFISYCNDCHMNLCYRCETEHYQEHKNRTIFSNINPSIEYINEMKRKMALLQNNINQFCLQLNEIINSFYEVKQQLFSFYKINERIINNFDIGKRNFHILKNVNNLKDNIGTNSILIQNLTEFISERDFDKKLKTLGEIYQKIKSKPVPVPQMPNINFNQNNQNQNSNIINQNMNNNNNQGRTGNELSIIYDTRRNNNFREDDYEDEGDNGEQEGVKIRIFGREFVYNNKEKCVILVKNVQKPLSEFYEFSQDELEENHLLVVTIVELQPITDMSYMFHGCKYLLNLPDLEKWDTKNVTKMNYMFGKLQLKSLSDLSKWNTQNVVSMSAMFMGCRGLEELPDISTWDTKNVTSMECMFMDCRSLKSLPDISKWDTGKVTSMESMFSFCQKLTSLPNLRNWNLSSIESQEDMFDNCELIPQGQRPW